MPQISFPRLLLYGFVTYASIFMLWALFSVYGFFGSGARGWSYLFTVIIMIIATRKLGATPPFAILIYSIGWTLMHMGFDLVYVANASGFSAILTTSGLFSYGLVFFVPLLTSIYIARTAKSASLASAQ